MSFDHHTTLLGARSARSTGSERRSGSGKLAYIARLTLGSWVPRRLPVPCHLPPPGCYLGTLSIVAANAMVLKSSYTGVHCFADVRFGREGGEGYLVLTSVHQD